VHRAAREEAARRADFSRSFPRATVPLKAGVTSCGTSAAWLPSEGVLVMSIAAVIGPAVSQPSVNRSPAPEATPKAAVPPAGASLVANALASASAEATESPAQTAQEAAHGDQQAIRIQAHLHAGNHPPRPGHKLHVVM